MRVIIANSVATRNKLFAYRASYAALKARFSNARAHVRVICRKEGRKRENRKRAPLFFVGQSRGRRRQQASNARARERDINIPCSNSVIKTRWTFGGSAAEVAQWRWRNCIMKLAIAVSFASSTFTRAFAKPGNIITSWQERHFHISASHGHDESDREFRRIMNISAN